MTEEQLAKLETIEMKLFRVVAEMLDGGRHERLDYNELARRVPCSRSAVRYNIGKLFSAGLLGIEDGKLYLKSG